MTDAWSARSSRSSSTPGTQWVNGYGHVHWDGRQWLRHGAAGWEPILGAPTTPHELPVFRLGPNNGGYGGYAQKSRGLSARPPANLSWLPAWLRPRNVFARALLIAVLVVVVRYGLGFLTGEPHRVEGAGSGLAAFIYGEGSLVIGIIYTAVVVATILWAFLHPVLWRIAAGLTVVGMLYSAVKSPGNIADNIVTAPSQLVVLIFAVTVIPMLLRFALRGLLFGGPGAGRAWNERLAMVYTRRG